MVKSMTGFGKSRKQGDGFTVNVEMKTVNHRFCEQLIKLPKQFLMIEEQIKKTISTCIHRGRAEVFIAVEGNALNNQKVEVDWLLLDRYHQLLTDIKNRYSIQQTITIDDLLQNKDCFQLVDAELNKEEIEKLILLAVEDAVLELDKMREKEGETLKKDILFLLESFKQSTSVLEKLAPQVIVSYREKIKARVESYLQDVLDESRLASEVAVFSEKADINEELIRLKSHLQQFHEIIEEKKMIGRKLDFLLQEMNREVNTIGSKANSAEIGKEVVEMKSYLEKIKEQIQNME
ncbi:YicC/YloC family endoribonuclease [Niallia nealsonii]|uniref:YicC family protein n=1 Tax=Niallia nealsonii TaxID=115979 RepID=A0A2N0Z6S8_9BACI|nr:YicC/YloC family endoribonuclease [Niallia nealsonii]PKG25225.1 YicC family protein [Niallia nealsonii]